MRHASSNDDSGPRIVICTTRSVAAVEGGATDVTSSGKTLSHSSSDDTLNAATKRS